MNKRDSKGRFTKKPNKYVKKGDIVECYSEDGTLLFFTDLDLLEHVKQYNWAKLANGYSSAWINKKQLSIHRHIMNPPSDKLVDHINGNKKDNKKSNLRVCDKSKNAYNTNIKTNNKSGVSGVWYRKDTKKWVAEIKVNYKKIHLGCYSDIEDAKKARLEAEEKYIGEYRRSLCL